MTKQDALTLQSGTMIYCHVHGCEGWYRLIAVRPRDGYIKIDHERVWCPPHNFELRDAAGKEYSS